MKTHSVPIKIEIAYPIYKVFRNQGFTPEISLMYTKIILMSIYVKIAFSAYKKQHGYRH